ncbi:MAG: endonuclease III [Gemmatimonadales bacterium]
MDELMLTILSQSTSDTNRDRAYESLRQRFPTWEGVRSAPRSKIEEAIRPAGLWKQKARVLQETLDAIHEDRGALDLSHLASLSNQEVIEYLTSLRGVGVKTAACVLCFSMGRDYMPVDTHVLRVARRLGLIPSRSTADQAHAMLNRDASVPPELRFSFHIQLIRHGRAVCKANHPACEECVLDDLCPKVSV